AAELPKVEMPEVALPKVEMPEAPKFDLPAAELPKFDMPAAELPKVEMPEVAVPKVELPEAPKFDAALPHPELPALPEAPKFELPEQGPLEAPEMGELQDSIEVREAVAWRETIEFEEAELPDNDDVIRRIPPLTRSPDVRRPGGRSGSQCDAVAESQPGRCDSRRRVPLRRRPPAPSTRAR
ncbi:MAG: hypothetical protein IT429_20950, partial [Gemmataceae bacterium]|nr:hypothetical protein [Gemmataceae bacterium]